MTIQKFIGTYEAFIESDQHENFKRDLWSVLDNLGQDRFRQVAIEVLGDIPGSELKMFTRDSNEEGFIAWGKKGEVEESGFMVSYSLAVGQQGVDWVWLLKGIAASSLISESDEK